MCFFLLASKAGGEFFFAPQCEKYRPERAKGCVSVLCFVFCGMASIVKIVLFIEI
jgi:hypothetical protein